MSCTSPLRAFKTDILLPSGKNKLLIRSLETKHVFYNNKLYTESILIPCGICMSCRLARSRDWANRMTLESLYHEESWFLTLTYNDKTLPKGAPFTVEVLDEDSGGIIEYCARLPTLVKRDAQLFMKRLRRNSRQSLRVYYVGEYGSKTYRPHYHFVVFGLCLNDLYSPRISKKGHTLYKSKLLDKCWDFGYIDAAEVNWNTACYVARYVTDKLMGASAEYYDNVNILPPFSCMSNRPGIGYQYYLDYRDEIYKYDCIHINTGDNVITAKPPKYFDKLYQKENPEHFAQIQANRQLVAESLIKSKLKARGVDFDYLLPDIDSSIEEASSSIAFNNSLEDLIIENLIDMNDTENRLLLSRLGYILEREKYEKEKNT